MIEQNIEEKHLAQYLAQLYQQLEAAYSKLGRVDGAEKVRVQSEIEGLKKEIENENKSLNNQEVARGKYESWESSISTINYQKATGIFNRLVQKYEREQLAACFLIQNSRTLGGKWCIEKLKNDLQYHLGNQTNPYQYPVSFLEYKQRDGKLFLDIISPDMGLNTKFEDIIMYQQQVINKICDRLRICDIIFFEIELYSSTDNSSFIQWFIQNFWTSLIQEVSRREEQYPLIKLVAIISLNNGIKRGDLDDNLCCSGRQFDRQKIVKLPLQLWTEKEIKTWLWKVFCQYDTNKTPQDIETIAQNIYRDTKGTPQDVHEAFNNLFQKLKRN